MVEPNDDDRLKDSPAGEAPPAPDRASYTPPLDGRRKGRGLTRRDEKRRTLTGKDRLYLLDAWLKSKLPAGDFAPIVGVTKHSLYAWKKAFTKDGPAGLETKPRGNSKKAAPVVELTKRAILLLKETNPEHGCERISALLARDAALAASPATVARVLKEAGYESAALPTRPHAPPVRRFEREKRNELWQTDLFTFVLRRQNRRVYLVGFMDDSSRFVAGYGLHASQSTSLVLEVFRAAVASHGAPKEVLTDNGSQYVTWRGKSAFSKECERQGIKQIVASPHRPQTLGKVERFWATLWRECLEAAVFLDLEDARRRIGLFIDHYNFRRPHQGIDNLVPADRFFGAAPEVRKTIEARIAANALELARHGVPRKPFYLTGQIDGQPFSVHAEGERLFLTRPGGREEVELTRGKDVGRRVLDAVARRGEGPERRVKVVALRLELAAVPRAEVDAAILELARQRARRAGACRGRGAPRARGARGAPALGRGRGVGGRPAARDGARRRGAPAAGLPRRLARGGDSGARPGRGGARDQPARRRARPARRRAERRGGDDMSAPAPGTPAPRRGRPPSAEPRTPRAKQRPRTIQVVGAKASPEARKLAAAILEVLGGVRTDDGRRVGPRVLAAALLPARGAGDRGSARGVRAGATRPGRSARPRGRELAEEVRATRA